MPCLHEREDVGAACETILDQTRHNNTAGTGGQWEKERGQVDMQEMYRVFNCGIGMVVVVADAEADAVQAHLEAAGETVYRIGRIAARADGEAQTTVS